MTQPREIRTAPFGHPPRGSTGNENEVLNPGRYQYCATSSTGYWSNPVLQIFDPWNFVWMDELFATTEGGEEIPEIPDIDEGNPEIEEPDPDPDTTWFLNRKNTWQSGPSDNGATMDNSMPKAGYWTKKKGPNSNDDSKDAGFQIYTGSDRPTLLFNMGHENVGSEPGSSETNVIGWDGYVTFESQGSSSTQCSMGICHAYAMYAFDMDIYTLKKLAAELKAWIEANLEDRVFTPSEDPAVSHVASVMDSVKADTRLTPTIELAIRVLKMIVKILDQMNSNGVVGGKLVNWDYIAELKFPTNANEYLYCPGKEVENPSAELMARYSYGTSGPYGPFRYSYTIDQDLVILMFILKLRANGVLWHFSSPKGGNRARIIRVTNFAHIHCLGANKGINHSSNSKYRQILARWAKNMKSPHAINDIYREIDTRG